MSRHNYELCVLRFRTRVCMYVCIYMDVIMDSSRLIIVITIPD